MFADHQKRPGIWNREHHLDRLTLGQLVVAYFQYYAIQAYLLLAVICIAIAFYTPPTLLQLGASAAVVFIAYPMIWYVLHRYVLHSQWAYKSQLTAKTWKRIHYDHHQDPNRLSVLFGALYTTLPTVGLATVIPGYLIGGVGAAAAAFAIGLLMTAFYEFAHCIQHLSYKPKNRWLAAIKQRHLEHHFHDESGNFGVTSFWPDALFRTYYTRDERKAKSPTVFNLGYTDEVATRYPWVAELSGGVEKGHPRRRARQDAD